ncbi:MAG: type II toxin-antitoxin system RelE/ParE family toxin [Candidatus Thermoplasmatota archaeon]|nr:type II toxin-antitoxin system RelE/ParE family toxin [Candidatus Thermoplasmatota archaeon]
MYKVIFSKKAASFVKNLRKGYRNKIKDVVEILRENPFGHPYKKIRGETNIYRIRIGKYRVLYELNKPESKIIIIKVDKRDKMYRF